MLAIKVILSGNTASFLSEWQVTGTLVPGPWHGRGEWAATPRPLLSWEVWPSEDPGGRVQPAQQPGYCSTLLFTQEQRLLTITCN